MEATFEINAETTVFLKKQIHTIKKGWYLYAPIAILVIGFVFVRDYSPEKVNRNIITILFTMGIIYLFAFVINPLRRLKVLNHVVSFISFKENSVHITTYPALWKKEIELNIATDNIILKNGASEKANDLFGHTASYRILDKSTGKEFIISVAMFADKETLENSLKNYSNDQV